MDLNRSRREFLGLIGGGAAAALIGCAANPPAAGLGATPGASSGPWDDSWTRRLGPHRVAFDVADLETFPGAAQIPPVMDAYHEALGTTDQQLGFVAVIRHFAALMLLQDSMWAKRDMGGEYKRLDPSTKAPYRRNPFAPMMKLLHERGVTILGCNSALQGYAAMIAQREKSDVNAVRAELLANLMPGTILQPNGLYALARAQNVGCAFMR